MDTVHSRTPVWGLVGQWTISAIAADGTTTLNTTATVTAAGPGTNTAEVTASDQPDPDSIPNNHDPAEDDQASVSFTRRLPWRSCLWPWPS